MNYKNINADIGRSVYHSFNCDDTMKYASGLSKKIATPGTVICIAGPLGSGKTTFAKGFAKGLGIAEEITSPTFTIINEYYSGIIPFYHFDCYRLESGDGAICFDFDEYFYSYGVCLIEWAENIKSIIPPNAINITIAAIGTDERTISTSY